MRARTLVSIGAAALLAILALAWIEAGRGDGGAPAADRTAANGASDPAPEARGDGPATPSPDSTPGSARDADPTDGARKLAAADPPGAGDAASAPDPRITPARLDRERPEVIRSVLAQAIDDARRARPLSIPTAVVDAAAEQGGVRVIFDARSQHDAATLERTLDSRGSPASVEDLRLFPLLGHGAAKLSPGALLNLIAETPTETIELDGVQHASLLESVPQIGADLAQADGFDGDGFAIAVIDTGVDLDHPMFADRLIEEACFSVGGDCPNAANQMFGAGAAAPCALAGCDHGTHIAGIALGDAPTGPLVGVAPHAELIAINVFSEIDGEPGAYTSDILAAMQHVLALEAFHDVAAVNLSLGGELFTSSASCDADSPSQRNAVAQLRNAGIATVAASGNDGLTNAISSPACLSNVIGVGSVDGMDEVSSFSNSAEFLTLLAPGESIQSAAVGGGTRNGTGTSMATPHVSGAIAAMREAAPGADVDAIENALVLSGLPVVDGRNGITTPRVRVDQAIAMVESGGASGGGPSASSGGAEDSPSGGGGGGCGLVGIEPFLILALVRRGRARLRA